MSELRPLASSRIAWAFAIAILADLIQLPLIVAFDTAILAVPAEAAIFFVDLAAFILTTALLRFHWVLLPSLAIEAIPDLDALPTWTACVAFVVWSARRSEAAARDMKVTVPPPDDQKVIDV